MPAYLPWSLPLLVAAALQLVLAAIALRRRGTSGSLAFLGLVLSGAIYAAGYAFELASSSLDRILLWNRFQYLGIAFLPAFWGLFSIQVVGGRVPRWATMLLFGLSTVTLLLALTDPWHGLVHDSPRLRPDAPFPILAFDKGPAYWFHVMYTNVVLLFGNVRLASALRRVPPPWRARYAVLAIGSIVPWAGVVLYLDGLMPWGLDLAALATAASTPVFAYGLFRLGMLDLVPVARDRVFEGMRDPVVVVDTAGRLLDYNPAARRAFPTLCARRLGLPVRSAALPEAVVQRLESGEDGISDLDLDCPTGRRVFRGDLVSVEEPGGRSAVRILTLADVTALAATLGELRTQAYTDPLTGALSRRRFLEVLEIEIGRSRRHGHSVSLLMMDLDHFKDVNDTYGHEAGDRVLGAVADSCREMIRGSDALGRLGGEEFAVLLPETGTMGARIAAERLRQRIESQRVVVSGDRLVGITISIGIASADPADPASMAALLDTADRGLYRAKQEGRNRVGIALEVVPGGIAIA